MFTVARGFAVYCQLSIMKRMRTDGRSNDQLRPVKITRSFTSAPAGSVLWQQGNTVILATASLVLGVAAAGADSQAILVAGVAGLVAGAMSMAAGEYVSVSSQADSEQADMARERSELATDSVAER